MKFHKDILAIDCEAEVDRICSFIREQLSIMKRDGVVIGLSGGVDSALSVEMCLRALGKEKVLGLLLPERESNPVSTEFAEMHAKKLGLNTLTVNITSTLDGFGTYEKRDSVIKDIFPEYTGESKSKIILPPDLLNNDKFNFFTLKIMDSKTNIKSVRLKSQDMRHIVAATDTKQRARMMHLYYYAEIDNYAVCGTTNRTELIQGFFVKYGDGGVDIEPIAHLYKMQVYQLAKYVGVIDEIIERPPSPDTFSFQVTDEEMYFRIPYHILDLLLYAWENKVPINEINKALNLTGEQVKRAFRDFDSKYKATNYLRMQPQDMNLKN